MGDHRPQGVGYPPRKARIQRAQPAAAHPAPTQPRTPSPATGGAEYLGPSLLFMTLVPFLAHLTAGRFTAYGQIPPTRLH